MAITEHRYIVLSPDGGTIRGYDQHEVARAVALDYGDGAHVIDTVTRPYHTFAEKIENGEPVYLGYGGWENKASPTGNLVEAIKKGYAPIVSVFAAKVEDIDLHDGKGGTPLLWAIARRMPDLVTLVLALGADPNQPDTSGMTPLALAELKGLTDIEAVLKAAIETSNP